MNSGKAAARWVATYGMLIGLACIFSYVEAIVPVPIPIPGVKLGLANLVAIVGLYTIGVRGTVAVSLVRIVFVGFTFGNASSMIYSMAGGIVSLTLMILFRKLNWFSQIGVPHHPDSRCFLLPAVFDGGGRGGRSTHRAFRRTGDREGQKDYKKSVIKIL